MAEIVLPPGNEGPVNDGERRVLQYLADTLPGAFSLHPNLQVAVGNGELVECDIIVLGPDCLWIVEVKDFANKVVVGEQEFSVNDEPRRHPVAQTRLKAQKIKTRLAVNPNLADVWIQPLVVLARRPASLEIAAAMQPFVVLHDRARNVIEDPTLIGLHRGRLPADKLERIRGRLALESSARRRRTTYGAYRTSELLSHGQDREWWLARQEVMGTTVLLEVVRISPVWPIADQARRRNEAYRAAKVRARVGAVPLLLTPETAFNADDGSVVVVHPNDPAPSLEDVIDSVREKPDDFKRRILNRIATAVDYCHTKDVVHRTIGPHCIFVPPSGNAKLGGFSRALVETTSGSTVSPSDWGALGASFWVAPEHSSGGAGAEADRFALGKLAEYLWPNGVPADLSAAVKVLLQGRPEDRNVTPRELALLALPAALPPAPPRTAVRIGAEALLEERYRVVEQLGVGSSGTVWRARDVLADMEVALKVYESLDAGAAVMREYQALLDVNHPNIVKVRNATTIEGRWVLISEFLDGPSLREAMPPLGNARSIDEAVSTALRVLAALKVIHPDVHRIIQLASLEIRSNEEDIELDRLRATGLTHRDVKPENIILVSSDRPVLIDFGLAAVGSVGEAGGTPAYRPAGVAFDHADPDIDLFAVGVILHELLTGHHPYADDDPVTGEFLVDPQLPQPVRLVLERACSPRFEDRFRTAQEFIEALVALGVELVPMRMPEPPAVELMGQIRNAMFERRWDEALQLCPASWVAVREKIDELRRLESAAAVDPPLLEVNGFALSYIETREFRTERDLSGHEVGPGTVRSYLVKGPSGEMLEILDHIAATGERWIGVGQTFETSLPLARLGQGLRMGLYPVDGGLMAELKQARVKDGLWSTAVKADQAELDAGAGADVEASLRAHGATGVGTRAEVLGDPSKRRNYMCMTVPSDNLDAPSVAHFLTKVLPLANGYVANEHEDA